jgi:septal ring-binding cell division protein DamX
VSAPPHPVAKTPPSEKTAKKAPPAAREPKKTESGRSPESIGPDSWAALARAGKKTFEHPGAHRYAIQLELACEESTLRKAFAEDPGRRQIWLAPYSFRGRECYRVLWGKYRDLPSARAAKASLPEMFSRGGNRPAVVSLGRAN